MPTTIATADNPTRRGSIIATAAFTDPDGSPVTPNSGLVWKLTNESGRQVINEREDVALTPASSVTIALTGDDLALFGPGDDGVRRLTITGTYDYDGSTLSINDYVQFSINDVP